MIKFKSTATKLSPIDYNKNFIIEQLYADKNAIAEHTKRLKELYKNADNAFMAHQIDIIIIKENGFNMVMQYLVTLFDFKYDAVEVDLFKKNLKVTFPNMKDDQVEELAKKLIQKGLIFNYLSIENNVTLSDEETKNYLEQYYKSTNQSINEYLNDKSKFDEIKNIILEEKITN